jgi:hypothetical protein
MMNRTNFDSVDHAELLAVQGGGLWSFLGKVVGAVEGVLRSLGRPWT